MAVDRVVRPQPAQHLVVPSGGEGVDVGQVNG
jgi:hypothetical protein